MKHIADYGLNQQNQNLQMYNLFRMQQTTGAYLYANDIEFRGLHFLSNVANRNGGCLYVECTNVDIYG